MRWSLNQQIAAFIIVAVVGGIVLTVLLRKPDLEGGIDWVRDPDAGLEQAASDGKPAALLFTADW